MKYRVGEFFENKNSKVITEIPEYLCCKITFDIMVNPVITPSGVTYFILFFNHIDTNEKLY